MDDQRLRRSGQAEGRGGDRGVGRDDDRRGRAGDRPVRVLEAVAGDGADDPLARLDEPSSWACSRPATEAADAGSTKTPSLAGEQPVGREDLAVGDRLDRAAGLVARRERLLPGGGVADADGGRDGRRLGDRCAV